MTAGLLTGEHGRCLAARTRDRFCRVFLAWVLCGGQPLIPYVCLAALEAAAVFGEALLYRKLLSYRRIGALRLSLLLNAASFAAGLVIALVESFLT